MACFSSPKTDCQLPSFHQQSTTTSPPKNHVQPPVFCQNPQQKQDPTIAKKKPEKAPLFEQVLRLSGDDCGGDHFVIDSSREPWRCAIRPNSPPTENGPTLSQNPSQRSSPEKVVSPKSLILWGFSRVLRGVKADSNYAWTDWRRMGDSNPR